jgi:DNA-binding beta-propeller fold protein YncE
VIRIGRAVAGAAAATVALAAGAGAALAPAVVPIRMHAGPTGLAYGHHRLWVTRDDGTVVRLEPHRGHRVGATHAGRFPVRVDVDRAAAWVVDDRTGSLFKLDARTGHRLRRTRVCELPSGVASAGASVWVVCALGDLVRVDAASGRVIARRRPGPAAADPPDLAVAQGAVWVAGLGRLLRVDLASGQVTATIPLSSPADVTAGAGAIWVANFDARRVTRIDPRRAVVTGSFRVGRNPSGVAVAGRRVWVLNNGDSTVTELDARSGRRLGTVRVGSHSYDIATGGGAVWVQSYGERAVFRIAPGRFHGPITARAGSRPR